MQLIRIILICAAILMADLYIFRSLRQGFKKWKFLHSKTSTFLFWVIAVGLITGLFVSIFTKIGMGLRAAFLLVFFLIFIGRVCFLPFLWIDDLRRLILKRRNKNETPSIPNNAVSPKYETIPRSQFLLRAGLIAGAVPVAALTYGTISGVYDYKVIKQTIYLPNLPKAFDGIRLAQISDIHSGSFYNKKAVEGGIDLLLQQKPDFIFFTGDLVNENITEMKNYQDIFSKVKAPLGVYSSLGNHDYGDYSWWPSAAAKKKNLDYLCATHKNMGWQLLRNENTRLKVNGEEVGILGVENWGTLGQFQKYGRMDLTIKNTDDLPVKLLLSHDPSHWRAEVLPKYPQIDMMFSGHTHGMQFGIRTAYFQWSPIKYIYPEWSGHYHEGHQQLYVNVGYGFLGYPGRLGILPEITIFELKAGFNPATKAQPNI
jgi:predicted MPP superfamily phosphohydrolase